MSSRIWLLQFCLLQFYVSLLHAIPPPPVQCYGNGCTVDNYQGLWMDHIPCKAANVVYPTTEEELVKAMAEAVKCKQKMKVVSKWSHTLSKFVCPGGDDGLLISTRDYSTAMSVNQSAMTITANAGVQLRTLIDYAADFGLALPYTTYWDGVSVTGVVSTGAHGSGLWNKGSALHEYITAMRLAVPSTEEEGYVRIVSLTDVDEDLDAARVSLGVLGVILQVTFALHPMFKRSVSLEARADNLLEEDVLSFAQAHDFGDITWYPSIRKALYRLDDLVSVDSPGDGINKYQGFQGIPVAQIEQARRGEEFLEKTRNAATACKISEMLLNKRVSDGNGFLNDGSSFTGFPVVGFNHLMQASGGCQDSYSYSTKQHILTPTGVQSQSSCASQKDGIDEVLPDSAFCYWDPRINSSIFYQTAIAVSLSNISELILDIKKIRDIDPNGLCGLGLYGGIMLRYMKKSRAFLGINEDVVDIDFTYFRSRDANSPRLNGDVMEEIEQMLMQKYDGHPHWAKNRDSVFYDGVAARRCNNLEKFLQVKRRFDPDELFSSEWSDVVLGLNKFEGDLRSDFKFGNKCALGGLCICFEDRHCDPDRGYFCRPGKIYKDARVCRFEESSSVASW